jgi:predicted GNAT superfamily acetyltransferase
VAGAFDEEDRMVGFVYSVPGTWKGVPIQWSHMLAVDPEWRGQRLGLKLKLFQRDLLKERGVDAVYWTYDPLEALNANLNLCRLGARPVDYLLDVYGDGSTSTLHRAIGTDRFVIAWSLHEELPVANRIAPEVPRAPIVDTVVEEGVVVPAEAPLVDAPWVRVEIPGDIQRVKAEAPQLAPRWRRATRRAFTHYFSAGYRVRAYYRDAETGRCFYVLARPA